MTAGRLRRNTNVFINCAFDESYKPIFDAIVFAVYDLGFVPRCALETDDSSETRLTKIVRIIERCPYGIHDISCVQLSASAHLPRFNMPLELGLYLGCKLFGVSTRSNKGCLILDSEPYRYRSTLSDISGQDIHCHDGSPRQAIIEVRNWLATISNTRGLPGGAEIVARYGKFMIDMPIICQNLRREPDALTFTDFKETVERWLESAR